MTRKISFGERSRGNMPRWLKLPAVAHSRKYMNVYESISSVTCPDLKPVAGEVLKASLYIYI